MKILQLCNKPPYPPLEGGSIAMNNIAQGLLIEGHQVKIIAVNSFKYNITLAQIPDEYKKITQIELVDVDLRVLPHKAFFNLFTNKSYHVERFISESFKTKLIEVLKNNTFDIVQIETVFLAPYISTIQAFSKAKIIIRSHNIEHRIWKRLADNCPSFAKKWYLNHLAKTLKRFELRALDAADGIITISKPDMDYFVQNGCKKPIKVIPFGISQQQIQTINPKESGMTETAINIGYIGAMNWFPNIEGVKWFLDEVWDKAFASQSKVHFHLAGRAIPEEFYEYASSNVTVHGEVEDAYQFINDCDIMVTPLFSGSGIRIKIVESMLHGKPVITTKIGAEGINYRDKHDIVIANSAVEFIDAIKLLIENHDLRKIIGVNAHELIHLEHNTALITPRLVEFYKSMIGNE
jgi:polysaccharide biosynthesis protein PslH